MNRKGLWVGFGVGTLFTLSLIVFVGLNSPQEAPPKEGESAREERQARTEAADRAVGYDPANYLGFDPMAFFVPPKVSEIHVEERHALHECALEFAASATDAPEACLFTAPGQRIGLGPVFGDPGFHVHVLAGGQDRIFRPDARGNLVIEAGPAPAKIVLVTTPFTIDYPSAKVFIPPYTLSLNVLEASKMTGIVAAQSFARAIKPTAEGTPDLFVATMPRNDNEFVFAAYDLSGKRDQMETGLWLTAGGRHILQPTFRAWVEESSGRVNQKVEVLPFPPSVGYAAAGSDLFDLETEKGTMARVPVPPRPHVDAPDTTQEPLPSVNVTATFYGFPKSATWRVVTGQGYAKPGKPAIQVERKEQAEDLGYQVTSISAERDDEGHPIPRSAFYSLRVTRKWEKEGGCCAAPTLVAMDPSPLGERVPYVPTTKLLHAKVVRLGGAGAVAVPSAWNPLTAGILADTGVRAALGLKELLRPSKSKGSGTTVVVNNYINTEGGGLLGGGGGGGGPGNITMNVNSESDWMGRWAYERMQENRQKAEEVQKGDPYRHENTQMGSAGRGWNGAPGYQPPSTKR